LNLPLGRSRQYDNKFKRPDNERVFTGNPAKQDTVPVEKTISAKNLSAFF
jgi:hypothetical protein